MDPGVVWPAAAIIVLGAVAAMLNGWIGPRPKGLPVWSVALMLVALTVCLVGVWVVRNWPDRRPDDNTEAGAAKPPGPSPTETIVSVVPPELASRILLSTDDSSGSPVLFSSRGDGSERRRVRDWGGPGIAVPHSETLLLAWNGRLEIRKVTGEHVRTVTRPPKGYTDESPAIAGGTVYFIRLGIKDVGGGTSVARDPRLMNIPLDGTAREHAVATSAALGSVSVSSDGSVKAGTCSVDDPGNVGTACLVGADGRLTRIPGSDGSTMSDVAVSPDGRHVAYSSFTENPYGGSQVFVYDVRTGHTADFSRLPGNNDQPAWAPGSRRSCLAFHHSPTDEDSSVYVGCLGEAASLALPVGKYPIWLSQ